MRTKKIMIYSMVIIPVTLAFGGCTKSHSSSLSDEAKKICGSWAYNHEKTKEIADFREDGTATYEDKTYTFDCDDTFITLKADGTEELKLRYVLEKDGMLLYKKTEYSFDGEGTPETLVGKWTNPNKWSFEFTQQGTFLEDGYFPGRYVVDEAANTCKLIYNDQFTDTLCYYELNGATLTMDYPWQVVTTEK